MRGGKWWQPNREPYQKKNYNDEYQHNYSTTGNGNIPVVTTSPYTADAGNTSYAGWNDWKDWGEDNGDYQSGYGNGQDQSWNVQDDQPYDSTVRVPYQREVDNGGKRKTQAKMNSNKPQKKAKVDKDPKR